MSLARSEYRTERHETRTHQSGGYSGHAKNSDWDNHFNNLLTDLNTVTASDKQRMRSDASSLDRGRSALTSPDFGGGSAGNRGDFHERHEYTSPDRRTHVVEERYGRSSKNSDNQMFSKNVQQRAYTRTQNYDNLPDSPDETRRSSQLKQNIRQIDNILDDLDSKPKSSGSSDFNSHLSASDTSTPYHANSRHVQSSSSFRREQQHSSRSSSVSRHTPGDPLDPSALAVAPIENQAGSINPLHGIDRATAPELFEAPSAGTTRVTRYEYRRSSRRQQSVSPERQPRPLPDTARTTTHWQVSNSASNGQQREDTVDQQLPQHVVDSLPAPPPTHPGTNTTINYHIYHYGARPQSTSPPPGPDTTVSKSYVYQSGRHRSASSGVGQRLSVSPPCPKFPVSNSGRYSERHLSGSQINNNSTTTTTTTTTYRMDGGGGEALAPPRSPSPAVRRPRDNGPPRPLPEAPKRPVDAVDTPKHVDELMAQIPNIPQDGTYPDGPRRREVDQSKHITVHEQQKGDSDRGGVTLDARSGGVVPAARPVYYPPGSNQFKPAQIDNSHKMVQSYESSSASGGRYKGGYKASGNYKIKGGYKERHSEGGAVVPVCLPLCCGAACSIM